MARCQRAEGFDALALLGWFSARDARLRYALRWMLMLICGEMRLHAAAVYFSRS